MNKEVKKLAKRLRQAGYSVVPANNQHFKVLNAEGRRVGTLPCSPSDVRSLRNTITALRRKGVVL